MNRIFICLVLIFWGLLMIGCKNSLKDDTKQKIEIPIPVESEFLSEDTVANVYPDTTINKRLLLTDYYSTEQFYPNYKTLFYNDIIEYSHPFILFLNQDTTQYLMAYTYEGSTKNGFDCFMIGYLKNEKKLIKQKYFKTEESSFETESGITLGMSLTDLIEKKGSNYKIKADVDTIITYRINNQEKSDFLERYQMPGYFMSFTIKENKIYCIQFGFDYP